MYVHIIIIIIIIIHVDRQWFQWYDNPTESEILRYHPRHFGTCTRETLPAILQQLPNGSTSWQEKEPGFLHSGGMAAACAWLTPNGGSTSSGPGIMIPLFPGYVNFAGYWKLRTIWPAALSLLECAHEKSSSENG